MRYRYFAVVIAAASLWGTANAGEWGDALVWMQTNVTTPFFPGVGSATNLTVTSLAAACPGGTQFPAFTGNNVPFGTGAGNSFGPTTCDFAGFMTIDIEEFARRDDLLTLQPQVDASNEGVAMAFAMAGVADLQADERFAVSMNWGSFGDKNAAAVGVAFRVIDHVSVNGSIASAFEGGRAGGRAGIRIGW